MTWDPWFTLLAVFFALSVASGASCLAQGKYKWGALNFALAGWWLHIIVTALGLDR